MTNFSTLEPAPIRATIEQLARRVNERFPNSGLGNVASELVGLADRNEAAIKQLARPLWWVRALTGIAIMLLLALVVWAVIQLTGIGNGASVGIAEFLQAIDAATNQLLFLGLSIIFLMSLEVRIKRRSALQILHQLRSIAHVVDMHQLTKDPESIVRAVNATASSPVRTLSRDQLARYLDYCSELLALTSKLAALHAQHLQDPVVLDAVNDIESLTTGLSRKIWQKITILEP
ncbi:MAG: hypothetical protein ABIQ97_01040 [Lysobacteraceae bacterium]